MRIRHHALVFAEADRPQRRGRQRDRRDLRTGGRVPHQDAIQPAEQQFVESIDEAAFAVEIKAQAIDLQVLEGHVRERSAVQRARRRTNRWPSPAAAAGWAASTPQQLTETGHSVVS